MTNHKSLFANYGIILDGLVISYVLVGYICSIVLITLDNRAANVAGVFLLTHSLVIAAYLIHECTHNNLLFHNRKVSGWIGNLMLWIVGACYTKLDTFCKTHLQHHAYQVDFITIDYHADLKRLPTWIRTFILGIEWCHVPAVEIFIHGLSVYIPLVSKNKMSRVKVISVLIVRTVLFGGLAWYSIKALILYGVSYLLFVKILSFVDAFQHTYEVYVGLPSDRISSELRKGRKYEDQNTYSNPISVRFPLLNLLTLNFVYHNAHHARPGVPWYRLPALHHSLYGNDHPNVLPMLYLLRTYHHNRIKRIFSEDCGVVNQQAERSKRTDNFVGALGLSFLTVFD